MPEVVNPNRSRTFRLITIAASGMGSFMLGLWALKLGLGGHIAGIPVQVVGSMAGALCALAAAGAALSFFAGIDESADYVYQETHLDKLTGLFARIAMVSRIAETALATARTGQPVYLIDIDIDRFKQINDAIGYTHGDELVAAFAERLRNLLPEPVMGRIGAGEFAILHPGESTLSSFETMIETLIDQLRQPYQLSTHLQSVAISVGIVAMPKDGLDPTLLLRRSNLALQHARLRGVGNWAVFEDEMGDVAEYRQWIESELGIAFDRGDFDMHYQPQFDLSDGRIVGYEALMRWTHPERGMIPPMEFIPIAEETGMIAPLGEWALRKSCEDSRHLPEECFVAVNISPVQFMTKHFVAIVAKIMRETGISPHRLELEVTETAMMQDRERAAAILKELGAMGISVAVDDFGTGYSNLSYLTDFSFQKLKIDRSFIERLESDQGTGAVVSTIVGLSRALGVRTIAEGVETEMQVKLLKAAGCETVQGFFYGRPAPLGALKQEQRFAEAS